MKFCANCGAEIKENQEFCSKCESLITEKSIPQAQEIPSMDAQSATSVPVTETVEKKKFWQKYKIPIIVVAGLFLIGILVPDDGVSSVRFKHYDDYDEVLEDVSKAVANKDAHLLCQTMFDKELYGKLTEEDFSRFEKGISFYSSFSGGDIEFTSSSLSSLLSSFLPLDEYELNDIMHTYEYYYGGHPQIIEGYYFDVNVEIAGESDLFAPIHFFEVEGQGWKMSAYDFAKALGVSLT